MLSSFPTEAGTYVFATVHHQYVGCKLLLGLRAWAGYDNTMAAEIVPISPDGAPLAQLERARILIAASRDLTELDGLRDMAAAYSRAKGIGEEIQAHAREIVNRAERRIGQLLAETPRSVANQYTVPPTLEDGSNQSPTHSFQPSKLSPSPPPPSPRQQVGNKVSQRSQRLAAMPKEEFEANVAKPVTRLDRIARNIQAQEQTQQRTVAAEQAVVAGPRWEVRHGDFRTAMALAPGSVNAVITDPPYAREHLPLLAALAHWANYILTPDGVLVVLYGQTWLPEAYAALSGYRPYRWTGCYQAPGDGYVSMNRRVTSQWKPVLIYGGGPRFMDIFRSDGARRPGKEHHEWAAEISAVSEMVDRLSEPGQVVADPMCGSGTTLIAAQALGRHAVGCDADLTAVETTRRRLSSGKVS